MPFDRKIEKCVQLKTLPGERVNLGNPLKNIFQKSVIWHTNLSVQRVGKYSKFKIFFLFFIFYVDIW
jgi:hypothetical protein